MQPMPTCKYATATAAAITASPSISLLTPSLPPLSPYPPTQPPSYKPPEFRKSQLLRQYTSLLRSTPLMLLFQHNNLKSTEWMSIRRELLIALRKVDKSLAAEGREPSPTPMAEDIKLQIIQTGIFDAALRIVEYFRPELQPPSETQHPPDAPSPVETRYTHVLSKAAHDAVAKKKSVHALSPLLSGPLMAVTFPTVSPQHLKAVLSVLAPSPPGFPAPSRRANPGYYDLAVQNGLHKLLLLGARVEGQVFDTQGTRWVGGIEGGIDGLRGQLVAMLSSLGAGVTNTLESAGRSLYFTVEGRRGMLEEKEKEKESGDKEPSS